jgi:hypothetical protein
LPLSAIIEIHTAISESISQFNTFTPRNSAPGLPLSPAILSSTLHFSILHGKEMNVNRLIIQGTEKDSCMHHLVTQDKTVLSAHSERDIFCLHTVCCYLTNVEYSKLGKAPGNEHTWVQK